MSDTALMLSVLAGPDDRAPLSYDVDTRAFPAAVRRPSIRGWRVAWTRTWTACCRWTPRLPGWPRAQPRAFRSLGARATTASPSFAELNEIVLGTAGPLDGGAPRRPPGQWRAEMQPGLVWNIEQGPQAPRRATSRARRSFRSALWQRVRRFMERYDLLVLPTVAVRPFPVEQRYPTELSGKRLENYTQWFFLTYAISVTGLPVISVPAWLHAGRSPGGHPDRRTAPSGGGGSCAPQRRSSRRRRGRTGSRPSSPELPAA